MFSIPHRSIPPQECCNNQNHCTKQIIILREMYRSSSNKCSKNRDFSIRYILYDETYSQTKVITYIKNLKRQKTKSINIEKSFVRHMVYKNVSYMKY